MTLQKVREENGTIKLKPALSCPSYLICYHFDLATFPTIHKKKDENYLRFSLLELHLDFQTQPESFKAGTIGIGKPGKDLSPGGLYFPSSSIFPPLRK